MVQSGEAERVASMVRRQMARSVQRLAGALALAAACVVRPTATGAQQSVPAPAPVGARVSGVVFDSLSLRPLAGAVVQLVSSQEASRARSVETGASGAFTFDSVSTGTYLLGFYHPILDSLWIQEPMSRVDVRTGGDVRAPLAIPSAGTLRMAFCGPRALRDSVGVFVGFVRSATDALARPKSVVQIQWSEFEIDADGIHRITPSVQGETGEQGGVVICGVPIGRTVMLRAWQASDSSGFAELMSPASGLLRRDVFVGTSRAVAMRDSSADSTGIISTVRRGNGALRGMVRRPDGTPLGGARLSFWGSGIEATTTSAGAYRMRELPAGTYTLEARAVGFLPQRHAIDVMEGVETVADVRLESFGTYLDTVKVTAKRVYTAYSRVMREFEERRKRGFGTFLDGNDIAKRNPMYLADLARMAPGVLVVPGGFGYRILMRGGQGVTKRYCSPAVFIDGARVDNVNGDLDAFVSVQDIRAMEIYPRLVSAPAQYQSLYGCGSLLIWTGAR